MQVLVFKTNLHDQTRVQEVESYLDVHPGIIQWNVDLEDCDRILRIVSSAISSAEVEMILWKAGYYCEELN